MNASGSSRSHRTAHDTVGRLEQLSDRIKRNVSPVGTYDVSQPAWSAANVLFWSKSLIQQLNVDGSLMSHEGDIEYLDPVWYGLSPIADAT